MGRCEQRSEVFVIQIFFFFWGGRGVRLGGGGGGGGSGFGGVRMDVSEELKFL